MAKGTLRIKVIGDTNPVSKTMRALPGVLKTGLAAGGVAAGVALVSGFTGAMQRADIEGKVAGALRLDDAQAERAGEVTGDLYASGIVGSFDEAGAAVEAVMGTLDGFKDASEDAVGAASTDAINFATAFETDVGSAVQTAQKLLEEDLVGSAEEAFDVMTAGAQTVTPALRDELQEATNEYAGYFSDLGISAEEMYRLFAEADSTFELDKTGDAIKELQIRATDMSTASVEAYEKAGLEAEKMAEKILAGGDTAREGFQTIIDGLLSIEDPVEQSNAAIALFGTPLEDMSVQEIPEFLESLSTMEGGLDDVGSASEDLAEDLDTPSSKFQGFIQTIQTVLTDALEPFVDWFAENEDEIREWFEDSIETVMGWGEQFGEWWTEDVLPVLTNLKDNIAAWWTDTGRPAWEDFQTWLTDTGEKLWEWYEEDVEPAIASVVAAVEDNWPKLEEAWDTLGAIIGDVGDLISELASTFATETGRMSDDVQGNQSEISGSLGQVIDDLNRLLDAVEWVTDKAALALNLFKSGATGDLDATLRAIELMFPGLDEFAERTRKAVDKAIGWFQDLPERVIAALAGLRKRLEKAGRNAMDGFVQGLRDAPVVGTAIDIAEKAVNAIRRTLQIDSPSKRFMWLGEQSGEGFNIGLADRLAQMPTPDLSGFGGPAAQLNGAWATRPGGVHVENLNVQAWSDRFSWSQIQDELALQGAV